MIAERLAALRQRSNAAAQAAGRAPEGIRLVAVSKGQPVAALREALALGLTQLGENYVAEAEAKMAELGAGPEWLYLGPIQSNKTRRMAEEFSWVLSVASAKAARRLHEQRPEQLPPLNVCVQVNVDNDPAKSGVRPAELDRLIDDIGPLTKLRLRGLMTVPMRGALGGPAPGFVAMAELFERHRGLGCDWDTLSMGMSGDFEQAIAHGATQIRLGQALFGPRATQSAQVPARDGLQSHQSGEGHV